MMELYQEALRRPDRGLERLYGLAQRDLWREGDFPWGELSFDALPAPIREGAAGLITQVQYTELAALLCAARMVERMPRLDARLFCATQVHDEARHVRWFSRLLEGLGERAEVLPAVSTLMQEIYEAGSLEALVAGMQVMVEGAAHALFIESAALFDAIDLESVDGRPMAGLGRPMGTWLIQTVARDEVRHVAFGTTFLAARLPELDRRQRDALERQLERWGDLIVQEARAPDRFAAMGVDGSRFSRRCLREMNARLERSGLSYRLPPLEG